MGGGVFHLLAPKAKLTCAPWPLPTKQAVGSRCHPSAAEPRQILPCLGLGVSIHVTGPEELGAHDIPCGLSSAAKLRPAVRGDLSPVQPQSSQPSEEQKGLGGVGRAGNDYSRKGSAS